MRYNRILLNSIKIIQEIKLNSIKLQDLKIKSFEMAESHAVNKLYNSKSHNVKIYNNNNNNKLKSIEMAESHSPEKYRLVVKKNYINIIK